MSNAENVKRPELVLGDLLRKFTLGELSDGTKNPKIIHRAVVLAVDEEGGRLSGPNQSVSCEGVGVDGSPRTYQRVHGPLNPRNSVKVLVIDSGHDSFYDEDSARILWPFFPVDQFCLPVAPGEHVYAIFEDANFEHGLWVCRVSGQDAGNFVNGSEYYANYPDESRKLSSLFPESAGIQKPKLPSSDSVSTRVRPTKKRLSDMF